MINNYQELYKKISYSFKQKSLIIQALTHRSKGKNNYERLEFLGDSILSFVIAEYLYNNFAKQKEGALSQLRTSLVRGKTLSDLASQLGICEYIIFGASEKSNGQSRQRILEDVLEAIIGAIYLDSDFKTVKKCILNWYKNILVEKQPNAEIKDSKSKLQEILLQNGYRLPGYKILSTTGEEHDKNFTVELKIDILDLEITATSKTRKSSEQQCAKEAIAILNKMGLYEKTKN